MSDIAIAGGTLGGILANWVHENFWKYYLLCVGVTDAGKSEFVGKIMVPGHVPRTYPKTIRLERRSSGQISLYYPNSARSVRRTFSMRDLPGDEEWWARWFDVMLERKAEYVIYLFNPSKEEIQIPSNNGKGKVKTTPLEFGSRGFDFFGYHLAHAKYPGRNPIAWLKMKGLLGGAYTPRRVGLWANFADEWANDEDIMRMMDGSLYDMIYCTACGKTNCYHKAKRDLHPMFRPFKKTLTLLEKAQVPTMLWACSAATMYNMREGLLKMVIE